MTTPIPPVTPAHAEGITATEQAVEAAARCLWEDVFIAAGDEILWSDVDEPMVRNGMLADAERLVEAIAPIIAADVLDAQADKMLAEARQMLADTEICKSRPGMTHALGYRDAARAVKRAAAIARAGTSEADHG